MDFISKVRKAENIWVYGAGIVSKRLLNFFNKTFFDIKINGVVVSRKDIEYDEVCGYPIFLFSEIDTLPDSTFFFIAVSAKYKDEIINNLKSRGYHNYVVWDWRIQSKAWYLCKYRFVDRRKNLKKICFVLAGYKEFLWKDVFGRLKKFVPSDVEVCILSAGTWNDKLVYIAEQNEWSYFSTALNSVTLIQNMAIEMFPLAEWIYKIDEDVFLTRNSFEKVMETYLLAEAETHYEVGFSAPLIPLNGYSYIHLLEHLGKLDEYEKRFERALCGGSPKRMVESCDEAAAYLWGLESDIPQLDKLNEIFGVQKGKFSFCNVRFSIGFILYNRSFWEHFEGFDVSDQVGLGWDEEKICRVCMNDSYAIVVAEDTVVGHFSFGKQTQYMRKLYEKNPEWFAAPMEE